MQLVTAILIAIQGLFVASQTVVTTHTHQEKRYTIEEKIKDAFGDEGEEAIALLFRESGLNPYAINKSSGACGIAQALPCSKLPCDLSDVDCQIIWVKNYIYERYGTATNALAFWESQSPHWY